MSRRLVSVDPLTGTAQYVDYDESEDAFRYHQEHEAQPLLDFNRLLFNEAERHWKGDQRVASIPLVVLQQLIDQGIWNDPVAQRIWLNDPDNAKYRTRPGRV